jgi:hypothetical protein
MKPAETAGGDAMPRGFETLVQCLRQYVNANPSRFTARDEGSDRLRILTVIPVQITDQP